jgi:glucokinase
MAVVGVDIGGTNIRAAVFRSAETRGTVVTVPCRALGVPVPIDAFAAHVEQLIQDAGEVVDAVGIAVAAVVDHRTGYIKVGENVGWHDLPLQALLEERWALPVFVDGDAQCGALAEARLGSGAGMAHFLYVVLGTGIGHALVLNRRVWHGMHGAANVFGHLKVTAGDVPCYCGAAGCLCQYASGQGLARLGQEATGQPLPGAQVVEAYAANEPWARAVVEDALARLAFALSGAYNLLDIECVVFGGGAVSDHFPDLKHLRRLLEPLVYPQIAPLILRRAALGGWSVLTGAALLAIDGLEGEQA